LLTSYSHEIVLVLTRNFLISSLPIVRHKAIFAFSASFFSFFFKVLSRTVEGVDDLVHIFLYTHMRWIQKKIRKRTLMVAEACNSLLVTESSITVRNWNRKFVFLRRRVVTRWKRGLLYIYRRQRRGSKIKKCFHNNHKQWSTSIWHP
jgi:hypothetical protein